MSRNGRDLLQAVPPTTITGEAENSNSRIRHLGARLQGCNLVHHNYGATMAPCGTFAGDHFLCLQ